MEIIESIYSWDYIPFFFVNKGLLPQNIKEDFFMKRIFCMVVVLAVMVVYTACGSGSMGGQVKAIRVYDALGKAVLSPSLNASGENLEVNMSGLKSGLYFIRIEYGNTIETVRIVKL